jgi:DNA-binding MarR family transcriptional regulator
LTPQQHQALLAIKGAPGAEPLIIGDLAQALLIHPHSAVEPADRLAQLGLVERREDPGDHRRHLKELRAIRPALLNLLRQLDAPAG